MRTFTYSKPSTVSGMTLIELLMTLAIAAIIVTLLASGNFSNMVTEARRWLSTSNIQGNLQLAKTEAVTRNTKVRLCASSNASSAKPTCSGTGDHGWKDGFIMFTDPDANGDYDDTTEQLLRVGDQMPSGQEITAPSHYLFSPDSTVR